MAPSCCESEETLQSSDLPMAAKGPSPAGPLWPGTGSAPGAGAGHAANGSVSGSASSLI